MKIILSPAKKMNVNTDILGPAGLPVFLDKSSEILSWLKDKSEDQLKELWKCNDKIAEQNMKRLEHMDLYHQLTSKEYSKCIEKYLSAEDTYITITFCELHNDKLVTKGTYAKMARGEMVRYMAENGIENPDEIKKFDRLRYVFREDLSSETEYIFERR